MNALLSMLLLIFIAFLVCVTLGVLQELAKLRFRMQRVSSAETQELPEGSRLPVFKWKDMWSGQYLDTNDLRGKTTLIVFLSSSCSACREVADSLKALLREYSDLSVILVCSGKLGDCRFVCHPLHSLAALVCDDQTTFASEFGVSRFPTTILADSSGHVRIVAHPVSAGDFRTLISEAFAPNYVLSRGRT
jgi:thiol-disulfide isomerase/thioredoxin